MKNHVIKGNICYSATKDALSVTENGYVVCQEGRCAGVYENLPKEYETLPCHNYEDKIIIPGLVDLYMLLSIHSAAWVWIWS